MKVIVDKEACIGCGLCPSICDEVFEMQEDGLSQVILDEIPENLQESVKEAIDSCPTSAIHEDV